MILTNCVTFPDHLKESREKLKNLSKSWNKSVKRNSVDALFIDGHGVQNKSGAGESTLPKEFVAARNRVLDSDNDSDEDFEGKILQEIIPIDLLTHFHTFIILHRC